MSIWGITWSVWIEWRGEVKYMIYRRILRVIWGDLGELGAPEEVLRRFGDNMECLDRMAR